MKRTKVLMTAVVAITMGNSVLMPMMSTTAATVSEAKAAISHNKSKSAQILSQIEAANTKVIGLQAKVSAKNAAIQEAKTKMASAKADIDKLQTKMAEQRQEINARKAIMADQLVSLQEQAGNAVTGNVYVDFLLKSDNLSDLIARGVAVNKLNRASQDAMKDVQDARDQLSAMKAKQQAALDQLAETKRQLEQDKAAIVKLTANAKAQSAALTTMLKDNQSLLNGLEKQFDDATAAALAAKKAKEKAKESKSTGVLGSATGVSYSSSGNTYPWGQCTWYAKARSGWAGNGWGNGNQWGASAAAQGFKVNHTPAVGSLVSFGAGQMVGSWQADGAYGHVAYVESVSGDTITISQGGMGFDNPAGPNTQTISGAGAFTYIHPKG